MGEILLIDNPEIQELKKHVNQVQKEMELKQELDYQISIGGRIYQ